MVSVTTWRSGAASAATAASAPGASPASITRRSAPITRVSARSPSRKVRV